MRFHSIGTDNLRIGLSPKMGSCSLEYMTFTESPIREYNNYEDNIKYVVLIRDVMDKYKSGYKQDLLEKINNDPWPNSESGYYPIDPKPIFKSFFHRIFVTTKVESFESNNEKIRWGIDQIVNAHELNGGQRGDSSYRWLKEGHMLFKIWNQWQNDVSWTLMNLGELKNIYFLELKDLSNPKFLEWLQEKDEKWKEYDGWAMGVNEPNREGIPHINKTDDYFWTNMDLFWKEYTEGKIAKGVLLNSPFYPTENTEIKDILKDIELEQEIIDNIRENNERYIRL
tara:strand:- start:3017 stop:3865 length:849 start_codon:yes stop_codon:yes gene_type:complete